MFVPLTKLMWRTSCFLVNVTKLSQLRRQELLTLDAGVWEIVEAEVAVGPSAGQLL